MPWVPENPFDSPPHSSGNGGEEEKGREETAAWL